MDSSGRVLVADRGANNVKIFAPDGSLAGVIPIPAPTSVAALPGDEFAVTSLRYHWLMGIYGYAGTLVRAIGDPGDFAHGADAALRISAVFRRTPQEISITFFVPARADGAKIRSLRLRGQ